MAKLTLVDVTTAYESIQAINTNYSLIETALENTVSRDGTTPNSMSANLDMNGYGILNASIINVDDESGVSVADGVSWATEWANKAEDSLVSTAAGGDQVDDYSSLHHSAKAAAEVVLATAQVALADTARTGAELAETNAAASYDNFDDRYLGAKAADPTLDNDGDALLTGAMYFLTTTNVMRTYTGTVWQTVNPSNAAVDITITDSGTNFTGTEVETALSECATKTTTQTLAHKTLTSPVLNTSVSGTALETTITDTDTKIPTSGAVVDYVGARLVIPDNITLLLSSTNTTVSSWTPLSASAPAGATVAILRVRASVSSLLGSAGGLQQCILRVKSTASTDSATPTTVADAYQYINSINLETNTDTNTIQVNLDGSGNFVYQIAKTQSGTETTSVRIDLVGYYV